jgi:hypothetical protein
MKSTEWKVENLVREIATGVVTRVDWRVTVSETRDVDSESVTKSAAAIGTQVLPTADPESPDFVAYEALTEEVVVAWLKDVLTAETVSQLEAKLESEVDNLFEPITTIGKPW